MNEINRCILADIKGIPVDYSLVTALNNVHDSMSVCIYRLIYLDAAIHDIMSLRKANVRHSLACGSCLCRSYPDIHTGSIKRHKAKHC